MACGGDGWGTKAQVAGAGAALDAERGSAEDLSHQIVVHEGRVMGGVGEVRGRAGVDGVGSGVRESGCNVSGRSGGKADAPDEGEEGSGGYALVVHGDGCAQLGEGGEPAGGATRAKYEVYVDD